MSWKGSACVSHRVTVQPRGCPTHRMGHHCPEQLFSLWFPPMRGGCIPFWARRCSPACPEHLAEGEGVTQRHITERHGARSGEILRELHPGPAACLHINGAIWSPKPKRSPWALPLPWRGAGRAAAGRKASEALTPATVNGHGKVPPGVSSITNHPCFETFLFHGSSNVLSF